MVRHPEFTIAEWENAPEYRGPGINALHTHARTTILDFATLQMLAEAQEESGAFRTNDVLGTKKAPLKLGDIPAAFVKVESLNESDYVVHTPHGPEILVVVNGVLTIKNSRFASIANAGADETRPLISGDVVALAPEGVRLTALGLEKEAASLVLSILDVHPEQTELLVMQGFYNTQKIVDPEGRTKLPYEE